MSNEVNTFPPADPGGVIFPNIECKILGARVGRYIDAPPAKLILPAFFIKRDQELVLRLKDGRITVETRNAG